MLANTTRYKYVQYKNLMKLRQILRFYLRRDGSYT